MDVTTWLQGLGLGCYASLFCEHEIDWEVLPKLTAEDLKEIGIIAVGHRRKILDAIATLESKIPAAAAVAAVPVNSGHGDAERRQLTVVFCDLVDSTALATRLDPEDLRPVIAAYHCAVRDTVGRFGGFVAKYMGDGVLVYFGYPTAHEDDAERAVRAGLGLIDAVRHLDASSIALQARVGIASGLVVVGDLIGEGSAREQSIVGETPNLAARLQAMAEADTILIGDRTRRLVGALFELIDLGPQQLRGFGQQERVWRVVGASGVPSRFEALRSSKTRLLGRDEELALLLRRWQQAKSGQGRVVLISGEPGIGKSRLSAEVEGRIATEPHTRLRYFCSPYHQDSALYPFVAQLERAADFSSADTVGERFEKLRTLLAAGAPATDDIALIADLMSLPNVAPPLDLSPQRKRERLLEALLNQLDALASTGPVLMVFEDVHWMDATSRELLDLTVERIRRMPVLVIVTFRPEFDPPWGDQPHLSAMPLHRLHEGDGAALVRILAGKQAPTLTADIVAEIVERTDGVPLFVEELTKSVLENAEQDQGTSVLQASLSRDRSVPATLHAALIARLDRLGSAAKELAQIGAVLGRQFRYELIAAVAQRVDVDAGLERLTEAGLLFCRGVRPLSSFVFKHALVQDAAYHTLLRSARRELHQRVGTALERQYPEISESQPQILAHHFAEGGLPEKAMTYWQRAGRRSVEKWALTEALDQLRKGLQLTASLPDRRRRRQCEVDFQVAIGSALQQARGYAHPEAIDAFSRADALIEEGGDKGTPLGLSVLWGLCIANYTSGQLDSALRQARDYLSIARSQPGIGPRAIGHRLLGTCQLHRGAFVTAERHLERAAFLCPPAQHAELTSGFGQDNPVSALCYWAWVLWHRGNPDKSVHALAEARSYADCCGQVYALNYALLFGALVAVQAGRVAEAGESAERMLALNKTRISATGPSWARVFRGWSLARSERSIEGVELIREGIALNASTGAKTSYWPWFHALLGDALAALDEIEAGLRAVADGLEVANASGERSAEAELLRLRGEMLLRWAQRDGSEAETCLRKAVEIARSQGSHGYELRAVTSLARLWRGQKRRREAHELLAPVYGWFTEGYDTPDLEEAKTLLDELRSAM